MSNLEMKLFYFHIKYILNIIFLPNKHFLTFCYFRVHVEQSADGRGLDLVFRSIQTSDDGEYSCDAILDGERENKKFHLNVIGNCFIFVLFCFVLFKDTY